VITSNVSSMPEAAGGAAILVNPYDVNAIAEAMYHSVSNDDLRQELTSKGASHYLKFDWDDQAQKVNELITALVPLSQEN